MRYLIGAAIGALLTVAATPAPTPSVPDLGEHCTIFEDGAALCHDGYAGWYFDEGTFDWDCRTMGNRTCG